MNNNRKTRIAQFIEEGYDLHITGRHVAVTESMKDYAIEKFSKIEKFTDRIIEVNITMDIQKLDHKVDIILKFNNIKIKSSGSSTDMYISIDQAIDKLQTQIIKYKDKLKHHHARGVNFTDMNVNVLRPHLNDSIDEVNSDIEDQNQVELITKYRPHHVVSSENKALKTLSLDECIMKMELSQDVFLIYRAEEDQKIKVIYRRNDGNYGVIEVE